MMTINLDAMPSLMTVAELLSLGAAPATAPTRIDVRSAEEYAAGHVDGAIHVPAEQLAAWAATQPRDRPVVTICGKGGGRSDEAAAALLALGFEDVRPLAGGTLAWQAVTTGQEWGVGVG